MSFGRRHLRNIFTITPEVRAVLVLATTAQIQAVLGSTPGCNTKRGSSPWGDTGCWCMFPPGAVNAHLDLSGRTPPTLREPEGPGAAPHHGLCHNA